MDPSTFEDVLILSYNDDLWDVYLVNAVAEEEGKKREIEKNFPREEEAVLMESDCEADEG